jgi:hypothetical protein
MAPLAESLTKVSVRRIQRDLDALREEKRRIEAQETILEQMLELKQEYSSNGSKSAPARAASATRADRKPSIGDTILTVMRAAEPHRVWSVPRLYAEIKDAGIESATPKSLGVALVRLRQSGDVVRVERGEYQLATNGAAPVAHSLEQIAVDDPAPSRSLGDRDT